MIIGHLPAGYICSKLLFGRFERFRCSLRTFIAAGMLGAIAPDFDMIYLYLVDHGQRHHHTYWTHYPVFWIGLLCLSGLWLFLAQRKSIAALAVILSFNGFLHMLLDSIVGDIWWFAPWADRAYALFTVPARYSPWWLNFILHWSFALEIGLVVWAVTLWAVAQRCSRMAQSVQA
jgi:inner membrane protein